MEIIESPDLIKIILIIFLFKTNTPTFTLILIINLFSNMNQTVKLPFYARLSLVLFSIVLIYIILRTASGIFIPLTFSLLFSILLYPVAKFLETKLHFGKALAAMTSIVLFVALVSGFIYFLILQFVHFSDDFPAFSKKFEIMFSELQHWLSTKFHITRKDQSDYINTSISRILESTGSALSNIINSVGTIVLWNIFILIFTFFMLYYRSLLNKFVLHLFSEKHRTNVNEVIFETKSMINGYILALVIEMILVSIVNCTMFLIMGIEYAFLLGIMAAFLNIIPYIGIYTSIVICTLITFANSSGNQALVAAIGLFIVHLIDANILMPRLVGGRIKMNPFVTILAVMVGEFLWGVPGMFLFIPITGIIKLICERVEGLEAWAILIGIEEKMKPIKKIKIADNK